MHGQQKMCGVNAGPETGLPFQMRILDLPRKCSRGWLELGIRYDVPSLSNASGKNGGLGVPLRLFCFFFPSFPLYLAPYGPYHVC
jgi:hypothetical protein